MRARLAAAVRAEFEVRKRRGAIMTFDDLLTRLDDALADDAVAARLRREFKVVLVDEFQDTDPVQWSIMSRAFGSGDGTLVLIGDPKQAIYSFRGADVYAYLKAARAADAQETLERNFRSDQGLLDAYDALFGDARLGHEGILYRRVRAARSGSGFVGAPDPAPLRVRVLHRDDPAVQTTRNGDFILVDSARQHIALDVAADLVALLSSATVPTRRRRPEHSGPATSRSSSGRTRRPRLIRDALEDVGVPAVINGAGSVFGTPQARDWLRLLEAIERPTSVPRARAAALTPFLGWSSLEVASADEAAWEQVHQRLHRWARVLRVKGVASLAEEITLTEGLPERVLRFAGGERRLTDLRHIAQLLHAAARAEHLGTTALTGWLRRRIAEAAVDTGDEERSRRLESDAEAVQVLTIHRSKGLEFPVVYLPYLWDPTHVPRDPVPIAYHDPDVDDRRTIDVGLEGPSYVAHRRQHLVEERGEDLRLAYVALTRAKHQAVVWWAASRSSRDSALSRLLFSRDPEGNVASSENRTPSDAEVMSTFSSLAAAAPISVARAVLPPPGRWSPSQPACLRSDRRGLQPRRRLALAADLVQRHHRRRPRQRDPFDDPRVGERARESLSSPTNPPIRRRSRWASPHPRRRPFRSPTCPPAPRSARSSTRSSRRSTSPTRPRWRPRVESARARRGTDLGDVSVVVAGLTAALATPLGPPSARSPSATSGGPTASTSWSSSCPWSGGDEPSGKLTLAAIASVLRAHGEPYADRLSDPRSATPSGGI